MTPESNETSTGAPDDMRPCPFCAEPIRVAAVKCRHCHSDVAVHPNPGGADGPHSSQKPRKRRTWRDELDRTVLALGVLVLVMLVVFFGIVAVSSLSGDDAGDTCGELEAWYDENPGDSNVSIAKDYYRLCDDVPPPVINGELSMDDVS